MHSENKRFLATFMWLVAVVFFAFQFILRLWPGLLINELQKQFNIDASGIGVLSSFYYYGYAGMQIPVAIFLDRYGSRYVIACCSILCGISMLLFTYSNSIYIAYLSRFIIGGASAAGFLGVSKVIYDWFFSEQFTKMIGYSFSLGLLGAIYGGKPIGVLIEAYDFESIACFLASVAFAIGFLSYLFIRPSGREVDKEALVDITKIKKLFSVQSILILGLANLLMVGALEGFADVWGISYLMAAYGYCRPDAAQLASFIFVGMLVGGPILAFFSKRVGNYITLIFCGFGLCLSFLFLFLDVFSGWYTLSIVFLIVGIMSCYQVIIFSTGASIVKKKMLSLTTAFLNGANMLGGSFFHMLIGFCISCSRSKTGSQGSLVHYSIKDYQLGLTCIPLGSLVGAFLLLYLYFKHKKKNFVKI